MIGYLKKIILHLFNEFLNTMVGFIVGVVSSNLMLSFFEVKGWQNLWGFWSSKLVLNEHLFTAIQWMISITVGYLFMRAFNKILAKIKLTKVNI